MRRLRANTRCAISAWAFMAAGERGLGGLGAVIGAALAVKGFPAALVPFGVLATAFCVALGEGLDLVFGVAGFEEVIRSLLHQLCRR